MKARLEREVPSVGCYQNALSESWWESFTVIHTEIKNEGFKKKVKSFDINGAHNSDMKTTHNCTKLNDGESILFLATAPRQVKMFNVLKALSLAL